MNKSIVLSLLGSGASLEVVTPPPAFLRAGICPPAVPIGRTRGGRIVSPRLSIEDYLGPDIMSGVIAYCDPISGNDAHTGLSTSQATLGLYTASRVANRRIIMVRGSDDPAHPAICDMDGTQLSSSGLLGTYIVGCDSNWVPRANAGVEIRVQEVLDLNSGSAVVGNAAFVSAWTKDETQDGIAYKCRSNPARTYRACDLTQPDGQGSFADLTVAASLVACHSTANTLYHDSANSRLYVHMADGKEPDTRLCVSSLYTPALTPGAHVLGLRYVTIRGGRYAFGTVGDGAFCPMLEDVDVQWTYQNGIYLAGFGSALYNRVRSRNCGRDNISDALCFDGDGATARCYALLIDCEGTYMGIGGGSNNGITGHGTVPVLVVDVNGLYGYGGTVSGPKAALTGSVSFWGLGTRLVGGGPYGYFLASISALDHCTDDSTASLMGAGQAYTRSCTLPGAVTTDLTPIAY